MNFRLGCEIPGGGNGMKSRTTEWRPGAARADLPLLRPVRLFDSVGIVHVSILLLGGLIHWHVSVWSVVAVSLSLGQAAMHSACSLSFAEACSRTGHTQVSTVALQGQCG